MTSVEEAGVAETAVHERRAARALLRTLLGLAVLVQVVVLYAPSGGGATLFPQADKVVHVLVFLVPVTVALLAGLRPALVVGAFAAQAVVSEVVQGTMLPTRSGDPVDVLADLVGIGLGVVVWGLVLRVTGGQRVPATLP